MKLSTIIILIGATLASAAPGPSYKNTAEDNNKEVEKRGEDVIGPWHGPSYYKKVSEGEAEVEKRAGPPQPWHGPRYYKKTAEDEVEKRGEDVTGPWHGPSYYKRAANARAK